MDALNFDFAERINDRWGLVTAGTADSFNAMTVSWGSLGVLWRKPVITVYVKPIRYTSEFLDREDYFTLSFFPDAYKHDLGILGSRSGRDCDKLAMTSLTPQFLENGIVFKEAELTIVCKKIYSEPLKPEKIPAFAVEDYYENEPPHCVYIGEIVQVIQ